MENYFASVISRFEESATLKMAQITRELRAQGKQIIDMSIGEPDFNVPEHIKQAAIKAIEDNFSHYPPVSGYLDLREAICEKLKNENNLSYKPEQIVVSNGVKHCIFNTIMALVDKGDEVLLPSPYWVSYSDIVKICNGTPIVIKTTIAQNFKITPEQLEKSITPKTKVILYSSPNNPTGSTYSKEEILALAKVLEKYPNIFIISDEVYEYINYVGSHFSIAEIESLKERTIVLNGFSKGFAMTGWRIGYSASNIAIAQALNKIQGQATSGINTIAQRAAIVALKSDKKYCRDMTKKYIERRALGIQLLQSIPHIKYIQPEGAFYFFPDMSYYLGKQFNNQIIANTNDLILYLLKEANVSTVQGDAFGEGAENCIRISFSSSKENIKLGIERIKIALLELK
ncbi:MAG: pyridoxal phosphate-dependent aminotransferase [Chitinophagaceae bacterium]